jgi:hypothetical protein
MGSITNISLYRERFSPEQIEAEVRRALFGYRVFDSPEIFFEVLRGVIAGCNGQQEVLAAFVRESFIVRGHLILRFMGSQAVAAAAEAVKLFEGVGGGFPVKSPDDAQTWGNSRIIILSSKGLSEQVVASTAVIRCGPFEVTEIIDYLERRKRYKGF